MYFLICVFTFLILKIFFLVFVFQSLQRVTAISERMKEQSVEIKKSKKKISFLEKYAKLDSEAMEKVKLDLAAIF